MDAPNKNPNGTFGTRLGFILASVGSAIGMGNIWMFPYRLGKYGGAAFLIPYFLFVALFGLVGLSGEFALGRLTGTGPVGSYDYAMRSRGKRGGRLLGAFPLLGSLGIAIGYAVIVGWVLRSMAGAGHGELFSTASDAYFSQATGRFGSVPWHLAVVLLTVLFLVSGIIKGIEKVNKVMMPAFFLLFIVIAVRVRLFGWLRRRATNTSSSPVGGAPQSHHLGHGDGTGVLLPVDHRLGDDHLRELPLQNGGYPPCLGAHRPARHRRRARRGHGGHPAVFAFGLDPQAGPPLIFITLPKVFAQMPAGRLFAVLFFLSVLFAGVTSLINMLEVCSEAVQRQFGLGRTPAVLLTGAAVFAVGLFIEYEPYTGSWDGRDHDLYRAGRRGARRGDDLLGARPARHQKGADHRRKKPLVRGFDFLAKYVYVFLAAAVVVLGVAYGGIG